MRAIRTTTISIFALGLLAGSAVGVAAQDEGPVDPAWVCGTIVFAPICTDYVRTRTEGSTQLRGIKCAVQGWTSDDPRFDGGAAVAHVSNAYEVDDDTYMVTSVSIEVRTDAGGWDCSGLLRHER